MSKIDELLEGLSEQEKEIVMKSLKEIEETGHSNTLNQIYEQDYEEIPVSIDEFIENPRYAGWMTNNGKGIYPYWRRRLREMFDPSASYQEVALTGSIGIGKSSIAIIGLAYQLYKLMCLKDPHTYYRIGKGGFIYVVFFNATLTLSQGVAYTKFQSLLQNSPWFLERGKVTGKKYLEYIPDKPIRFTVGSTIEHSLGKDIFCMSGDTVILTQDGLKKLEDIAGEYHRVYSMREDGELELSEPALICETKIVNELYEVELEDGSIIRCTGEHRLRLSNGEYKRVDKLTTDDELQDI